jgi:hypothetical protein
MTVLPDTYMPIHPAEQRVTVIDTDEDIASFCFDGGRRPDENGEIVLYEDGRPFRVPLKGLYRVQLIENGIPEEGLGLLMTEEQFRARYTEHAVPYFEYGVKFLPRRNDIVEHGSLAAAQAALDAVPELKASGLYGIVRRLTSEPGDWELVPE